MSLLHLGADKVKKLVSDTLSLTLKPVAAVPPEIMTATLANTPKFTLATNGKRLPARVIDVHDGDTIVVAVEIFGKVSSLRVRLAHIDSPELKPGANLPGRDAVIARAKAAKQFLTKTVLGKVVWMDILGYEKYGRVLADIFETATEETSVNCIMVRQGYAQSYEGGAKSP